TRGASGLHSHFTKAIGPWDEGDGFPRKYWLGAPRPHTLNHGIAPPFSRETIMSHWSLDRRQFLKQTAVAVTAAVADTPHVLAAKEKPVMLPTIDAHQRLWDLTTFKPDWHNDGPSLARNFLPADYQKATEGLNVVKTVYMEVDVDPAQQAAEAEYVVDICQKGNTPMVAAVISGRPASDGFKKYITAFKDNRYIKGIRQVLHGSQTPAGY